MLAIENKLFKNYKINFVIVESKIKKYLLIFNEIEIFKQAKKANPFRRNVPSQYITGNNLAKIDKNSVKFD